MYYTKYSRKLKKGLIFEMPKEGGYISVYIGKNSKIQICEKGYLRGETISTIPEFFKSTCDRWYRSFIANQ